MDDDSDWELDDSDQDPNADPRQQQVAGPRDAVIE